MGHADHLVTGDGDVLAMSPFQGIPIITPARFAGTLKGVGKVYIQTVLDCFSRHVRFPSSLPLLSTKFQES